MLTYQPMSILFGGALYGLTRMLKSKGKNDAMYFVMGWLWSTVNVYSSEVPPLFEIAYPPHPDVLRKRENCINSICYFHPPVVKHELEYLASKLF